MHAQAEVIGFADYKLTKLTITSSGAFSVVGLPTLETQDTASAPSFRDSTGHFQQCFPDVTFIDTTSGAASDVMQATSGLPPFPGQNDYAFVAGTNLAMFGAR